MSLSVFVATSDYQVIEREPLVFALGELVTIDVTDRGWPGWVWVVKENGRGGYVPEDVLQGDSVESGAEVCFAEDFDGRDLSLHKGEDVVSLRELDGWHWCRNEQGREGWVAGYLLKEKLS